MATLSNTDIEKAIRAKNRQDDQKTKDDKEGKTGNKIKLKKTEKKKLDGHLRDNSHLKKPIS